MRDAQLLPIHTLAGLSLAQMGYQPMAEFAHGHGRLAAPMFEQLRRRRVAQQIKRIPGQRQRRAAVEELHFVQRMRLAIWQSQPVREREFQAAVFQVRLQFSHLAVKFQCLGSVVRRQFKPRAISPPRQPLQQFQVRQHKPLVPL